jgi:hypothetical protein
MKVKIFLVLLVTAVTVLGIVIAASNRSVSGSTVMPEKEQVVSESLGDSTQAVVEKPGTIDGAKNPELIPDKVAYSILFRLIADRKTPEEKARIESYIRTMLNIGCKSCGLLVENGKVQNEAQPGRNAEQEQTDINAVIATAEEFNQQVVMLDNQAKDIKEHRRDNPQIAVGRLTALQAQKDTLVENKAAALINRLGLVSKGKLQSFVNEKLKQKIKIAPAQSTQTLPTQ